MWVIYCLFRPSKQNHIRKSMLYLVIVSVHTHFIKEKKLYGLTTYCLTLLFSPKTTQIAVWLNIGLLTALARPPLSTQFWAQFFLTPGYWQVCPSYQLPLNEYAEVSCSLLIQVGQLRVITYSDIWIGLPKGGVLS